MKVPLAQWIRRVPTEHENPGSSPGWYILLSDEDYYPSNQNQN